MTSRRIVHSEPPLIRKDCHQGPGPTVHHTAGAVRIVWAMKSARASSFASYVKDRVLSLYRRNSDKVDASPGWVTTPISRETPFSFVTPGRCGSSQLISCSLIFNSAYPPLPRSQIRGGMQGNCYEYALLFFEKRMGASDSS